MKHEDVEIGMRVWVNYPQSAKHDNSTEGVVLEKVDMPNLHVVWNIQFPNGKVQSFHPVYFTPLISERERIKIKKQAEGLLKWLE